MELLAERTEDLLIVCAGTGGSVTLEDVYLAGRLSAALEGERTDAARVAESVAAAYPVAIDALEASAGSVGIIAAGLTSDIAFCAQESITPVVAPTRRDARRHRGAGALSHGGCRRGARSVPGTPTHRRNTM